MSAMSLEAEKNELIRRILDVDDVAILRRVKSMLSCEEEQTNVVAEEAAPYQTKAEILATLICSFTKSTPTTSSVIGCSTCRRVFISRK